MGATGNYSCGKGLKYISPKKSTLSKACWLTSGLLFLSAILVLVISVLMIENETHWHITAPQVARVSIVAMFMSAVAMGITVFVENIELDKMTMIDLQNFRDPVTLLDHAITWLEQSHGQAVVRQSLAFEILDHRRKMFKDLCLDSMISAAAWKKGLRCPCSRHLDYWQTKGWKYYPPMSQLTQQDPHESAHHGRERVNGKAAAAGEKEEP
jgi:hypothetical protein